jgi:hypothetical protein
MQDINNTKSCKMIIVTKAQSLRQGYRSTETITALVVRLEPAQLCVSSFCELSGPLANRRAVSYR